MKINTAIIFLLVFGLLSCGDSEDCCTLVDVDVRIHYQTPSGENLLNSIDDYDVKNIKIYYKNGDDFEYVFDGNLDHSNMHYVADDGNSNLILTVFLSNNYEGNYSTTLIELNEEVIDTVVGEFDLSGNSQICTNAWLNGEEMDNRFITAVR